MYVIPMLYTVAVLTIEYREFRRRKKEYEELEHFAEFLSDLKNHFYFCKSVTESIFRAAERMPGSLRKRLEDLCFLLEEEERWEVMAEEHFPGSRKYMRLFEIQCRSAIQYGSGKRSTESVFIKNMTELRRDVQNECYQRAQATHNFSGMGIVAVVPMLFLPLIRWFGSSVMEELNVFYAGKPGRGIVWMFGIITTVCYFLLYLVRKTDRRLYHRPRLLSSFFSQSFFQNIYAAFEEAEIQKKAKKKLREAGIEASGVQYWMVCLFAGLVCSVGTGFLLRDMAVGQKTVAIGCGFVGGMVAMMGCYRYLGYLRGLGKGSEVLNLQAMILLLIDVPNLTIPKLLDALGTCAELFRKPILRCADAYIAEDVQALKRMEKEESYPAFCRLAGCLAASEKVGLKTAFSEIASDRNFFREEMRLDMEQERKKKVASAQVIAFLPMMFLLFAYLILPFLWVSLEQMREIFYEMEQIRFMS